MGKHLQQISTKNANIFLPRNKICNNVRNHTFVKIYNEAVDSLRYGILS